MDRSYLAQELPFKTRYSWKDRRKFRSDRKTRKKAQVATQGNEKILETVRGAIANNSLWKRVWVCRKTDCWRNECGFLWKSVETLCSWCTLAA